MAPRVYRLSAGDISFTVIKKAVRNCTLRIKGGELVVTAPSSMSDSQVILAVQRHTRWAEKHLARAEQAKGKVFLLGQAYDLKEEYAARGGVVFADGICVLKGKDDKHRKKALLDNYKKTMKETLPALFDKWQKETGLRASEIVVTSAKSYLGRCEIADRRIKISCRLARKSPDVIEYVVLHELCHLKISGHQKNFYALVSKYMPDYKVRIKKMKAE